MKNFDLANFDDSDDTNIPHILSHEESKKKFKEVMEEMDARLTQDDLNLVKIILADLESKK